MALVLGTSLSGGKGSNPFTVIKSVSLKAKQMDDKVQFYKHIQKKQNSGIVDKVINLLNSLKNWKNECLGENTKYMHLLRIELRTHCV